ncbi:MAG: hypothetical protein FWH29_00805 [Methanobrevibacter sp.]|nr:hypothetical protein [Methanobrevibacter sp.]
MINKILEIDESFIGRDGIQMPAIHVLKDCIYDTRIKYELNEEQPYTLVFKFPRRDFEKIKHLLNQYFAIYIYDDLEDFNENESNDYFLVKKLKKHHIIVS